MDALFKLVSNYPNLSSTAGGLIFAFITAFFAYKLKKPLQQQALKVELGKAQREEYEAIIKAQRSHIGDLLEDRRRLETEKDAREEYEEILVKENRELKIELSRR